MGVQGRDDRSTDRGDGKHTGLAALADEDFSVYEAIGGWRGIVESLLPGLVFLVVFLITGNLTWTIMASGALALVQLILRLLQGGSFLGALTGLLGVGICLISAWLSKDARNYYLPGFLINSFWILVLGVSLLVRIPGIGVLVEYVREPVLSGFRAWLKSWRSDPVLLRAYTRVTLVWILVFVIRLAVQVPLYFAGSVGLLGGARLVLGVPFFALAIWVSWLMMRDPFHAFHAVPGNKGAETEELDGIDAGANGAGRSKG